MSWPKTPVCDRCGERCEKFINLSFFGQPPGKFPHTQLCSLPCLVEYVNDAPEEVQRSYA